MDVLGALAGSDPLGWSYASQQAKAMKGQPTAFEHKTPLNTHINMGCPIKSWAGLSDLHPSLWTVAPDHRKASSV